MYDHPYTITTGGNLNIYFIEDQKYSTKIVHRRFVPQEAVIVVPPVPGPPLSLLVGAFVTESHSSFEI